MLVSCYWGHGLSLQKWTNEDKNKIIQLDTVATLISQDMD